MTYISSAQLIRVNDHFQATNATICGDVKIGRDVSVWFGATIRGDVAPITIGNRTNIQELCCLHCDDNVPLIIGDEVTVGHGAIVHCSTVGDGTLIGMGAIVLNDCKIGKNCLIAAGAVLSPGTVVPDGMVAMGIPGKVVRPVKDKELEYIRNNMNHYVALAHEHAEHPEKYYKLPQLADAQN